MGWDRETIEITISTSSHNSEYDVLDEVLAADLLRRLKAILDDPLYERIGPTLSGGFRDRFEDQLPSERIVGWGGGDGYVDLVTTTGTKYRLTYR